MSQKFKEKYNLIKSTEELKGAKISWKLKTCGSMTQYAEQWNSYRTSILKLAVRKLWNTGQYVEKLNSFKIVDFKNVQ